VAGSTIGSWAIWDFFDDGGMLTAGLRTCEPVVGVTGAGVTGTKGPLKDGSAGLALGDGPAPGETGI